MAVFTMISLAVVFYLIVVWIYCPRIDGGKEIIMIKKNYTYSYRDSGNVPHTVDLSKADFELTQADASIHDVKFKTKPTTFFKDALKRFSKNKSSVAGSIILGILLVFSFVLPLAIQNDTTTNHPEAQFLEPKLFNAGTGWWDGTKRYNKCLFK